jgi:alpha-glucosidase
MTIIRDGINAERFAEDYKLETRTVKKGDVITLDMAANGGWSAQLIKQ